MKQEETIYFDPSENNVLGVFGNLISVFTYGYKEAEDGEDIEFNCVLQMTIEEYHRVWDNWIKGKRRKCEHYGFFCGVMGYTHPEVYTQLADITINNPEYDGSASAEEFITIPCFHVERFNDHHDFERG